MLSVSDFSPIVPFLTLEITPGEVWGIVGRNGSGKSALAAALAESPDERFPKKVLVSFELEDALLEREIREDDTDFLDKLDPGRSVLELIYEVLPPGSPDPASLLEDLGMNSYLDRGFRLLSTGERRRLMLARAFVQAPDLLVLDEPFDGLDRAFRDHLAEIFRSLAQKITLVIVANRLGDLDDLATHLACVDAGQCLLAGPRAEIVGNPAFTQLLDLGDEIKTLPARDPSAPVLTHEGPLVIMKNVTVIHGGREIISGFDWQVDPGQNWIISGPNGCGKSTLVNLVTGDHPQCYSNDVTVMGMRRGRGESIWQIKNHIGLVSPALHQLYRVSVNALTVIVSGFHDSVGLYREVSPVHLRIAREWLAVIGMSALAERPFRSLSYGQQRLLLIARALVKQPPLLILDEPCQGLDPLNRALVLRVIDRIVATGLIQLLYITHEPDDRLECLTHQLRHQDGNWLITARSPD